MEQSLKILVVDDEEGIREIIESFLDGHKVYTSPDGVHGIQVIEKVEVDLVITDIRMPGGSGYDLLKVIRETRPNIPIIVISGDQRIEAAGDSLDLGAVSFLYKPFDRDELVEEIQSVFTAGA